MVGVGSGVGLWSSASLIYCTGTVFVLIRDSWGWVAGGEGRGWSVIQCFPSFVALVQCLFWSRLTLSACNSSGSILISVCAVYWFNVSVFVHFTSHSFTLFVYFVFVLVCDSDSALNLCWELVWNWLWVSLYTAQICTACWIKELQKRVPGCWHWWSNETATKGRDDKKNGTEEGGS